MASDAEECSVGTNSFPRELHESAWEIFILMGKNLMLPREGWGLHFSAFAAINMFPQQVSLTGISRAQQPYISWCKGPWPPATRFH